jgi:hypothetical protein
MLRKKTKGPSLPTSTDTTKRPHLLGSTRRHVFSVVFAFLLGLITHSLFSSSSYPYPLLLSSAQLSSEPVIDDHCKPFPLELPEPQNWESDPGIWVLNEVILIERKKAFWNTYYQKVCQFIRENTPSQDNLRIVEVGTAYGGNANAMAECFPTATILAVDPLLAGYDKEDLHSRNMEEWATSHGNSLEQFSQNWANGLLHEQRSKHGCRYHLIKALSTDAGKALKDVPQKFDIAFIDGLHTYEGVKDDIAFYHPLVKPGGILIFNDYKDDLFPGVTKAVDEFVATVPSGRLVVGSESLPPGATNAAIVLPS